MKNLKDLKAANKAMVKEIFNNLQTICEIDEDVRYCACYDSAENDLTYNYEDLLANSTYLTERDEDEDYEVTEDDILEEVFHRFHYGDVKLIFSKSTKCKHTYVESDFEQNTITVYNSLLDGTVGILTDWLEREYQDKHVANSYDFILWTMCVAYQEIVTPDCFFTNTLMEGAEELYLEYKATFNK